MSFSFQVPRLKRCVHISSLPRGTQITHRWIRPEVKREVRRSIRGTGGACIWTVAGLLSLKLCCYILLRVPPALVSWAGQCVRLVHLSEIPHVGPASVLPRICYCAAHQCSSAAHTWPSHPVCDSQSSLYSSYTLVLRSWILCLLKFMVHAEEYSDILESSTGIREVNFLLSVEPIRSSPCPNNPVTGLYREAVQSMAHPHSVFMFVRTKCMEQRTSEEKWRLASQNIPRLLQYRKVNYRVYKIPASFLVHRHLNAVHNLRPLSCGLRFTRPVVSPHKVSD